MKNKEQKKMQKVANRKKVALQHKKTDKELKKSVSKSAQERMSNIQLRRIKKSYDGVAQDTVQKQSTRTKKQ